METASHHGRETGYRATEFGEGPTVCYVHGAGASHQVWVEQYGDREGPPAVAVDLSGHGHSDDVDAAPGLETLESYADDVAAVCKDAGASVVCGHSMGGAVALWVALERDLDLEALVLCDTGAKLGVADDILQSLTSDFEAAVESLHAPGVLFHDPAEDRLELSRRAILEAGQTVARRDFETCDAFDLREHLDEIRVPAFALCGEHDRLTPPSFHEHLAGELPDCEYQEVAEAAHMPMLERPEAVTGAVRSFLL